MTGNGSIALADKLIEMARAERRLPGQIERSDMISAFYPIALRLHEKGVPANAIVAAMQGCAKDFERSVAMDTEGKRQRVVVVNPDPED